MGGFRIGRKHAQHTYPEPRRNTTVPFARNFASGPGGEGNVDIATAPGTFVPWGNIDVPASSAPTWNVLTAYLTNAIVTFSGATYIALRATTGDTPNVSPLDWAPVVPITPITSGVVLIFGVLSIIGGIEGSTTVQVQVLVDGVVLDAPDNEKVTTSAEEEITFLAQATGLSIGTTHGVQIRVIGNNGAAELIGNGESSTLNVQEVQASTG